MDNGTVFVGVSIIRGLPGYAYAALDDEKNLLAIGQGSLTDVVAYISGLANALLAVNAPQKPVQLLVETGKKAKKKVLRSADAALEQLGIYGVLLGGTPEGCPPWVRHGFAFYNRIIEIGYVLFSEDENLHQFLETNAEAVITGLLGRLPYPAETLEGRLQRQLILREQDIPIYDPMQFFEEITRFRVLHGNLPLEQIYQPAELNAMACAWLSWQVAHHPDLIHPLGTQDEGIVYIPDLPAPVPAQNQMRLPDIYPQHRFDEET